MPSVLYVCALTAIAYVCVYVCVCLPAHTDYLVAASPENIRTCMLWVNDDVSARGTTDIKTPLMQALRLLQAAPVHPGDIRLPVVFLLTDGRIMSVRWLCMHYFILRLILNPQ